GRRQGLRAGSGAGHVHQGRARPPGGRRRRRRGGGVAARDGRGGRAPHRQPPGARPGAGDRRRRGPAAPDRNRARAVQLLRLRGPQCVTGPRAGHLTVLLAGKRVLVTGVLTESSIAFSVARLAQEQGAEIALTSFGRAMSVTRRAVKRLPCEAEVLELDVTDAGHLAAL